MNANKNWRKVKLSDLGSVARGKSRHRPRNDESLYGGAYPFIQTGEVKAATLYVNDHKNTYNEKGLAQSKLWEPETLLITIAANIADTALLKFKACVPDSIVCFRADNAKSDVRFVKYLIDNVKVEMQSISKGTTQDNLSIDKLLSIELNVPDFKVQQRIANVLATYDDLIENNTRRIKILEDMARMIWREWFVKFRFPGWEQAKFVDTPHGQLPEGWEMQSPFDFANVQYGFPFQSKLFTEGGEGKPVIRIRNILDNKSNTYTIEQVDQKYQIRNTDILVGMDGDFHLGNWAGGEAMLNQRVVRFRAKDKMSQAYLFEALREPIRDLNQSIVGTTVAHLGDMHLRMLRFVVPTKIILASANGYLQPLYEQQTRLKTANANLIGQRDMLLPRLVTGEVEV